MNEFIGDYLERLRQVSSDEDVIELYHWFWDKQKEIKQTAGQINRELGLDGDYALKPDLSMPNDGLEKRTPFLARESLME